MIDTTTNNTAPADNFYDLSEVREAMADPRYKTSARYRDDLAAKLHRSQAAGTVGRMGEERPDGAFYKRDAYDEDANVNGFIVRGADPAWAEAGKVNQGFFKSPEEIAHALAAPACGIDPTYQHAVREKIARSVREGYLTADLEAANPSTRGR